MDEARDEKQVQVTHERDSSRQSEQEVTCSKGLWALERPWSGAISEMTGSMNSVLKLKWCLTWLAFHCVLY